MSILGTIATVAASIVVPGGGLIFGLARKFGKAVVLGKIKSGLKSGGGFIRTNWKPLAIIGGITAAIIYVIILHGEIRHWKKADAGHVAALTEEKHAFALEKHAFSTEKVSLDGALTQIADNNKRIDSANAELEREKARAATDEARNAKLAQSTDAEIAAVRASATDPHRAPCTLPEQAKKALDGL